MLRLDINAIASTPPKGLPCPAACEDKAKVSEVY